MANDKTITMKLIDGVFIPNADWLNETLIEDMKQRVTYHASFSRPRSQPHHRWFFALMSNVQKAYPNHFRDVDMLIHALKDSTGLSEYDLNPLTGKIMAKVGSISFGKMNEDEFIEWAREAIANLNEFVKADVVSELMPDNVKEKQKLLK